ncbi:nSTAND1 domain-containing NTPase [Streptomyces cyaneochromogenes]|uniref:nSTAND1 domain-containing NTPase n=1 Tax=Streptomyces cyaneochromogenes TaxID=2496836 RepID=UPI002B1F52EC|nr:hypothetical protein [Streptomyces cyaneochromogenes]
MHGGCPHGPAPGSPRTGGWPVSSRTTSHDRTERDRCLDLLLASRRPESRLRVVVAVRGDIYGRCAHHRELAVAVSRANLLVGAMNRDEPREVITGPATADGLNVERVLTARIIDEAVDQPGGSIRACI